MQGKPLPEFSTEIRLDFVVTSETNIPSNAISACIPTAYIPDERLRIAIYRRIAEASSHTDIKDLEVEIIDRFGPMPKTVSRLIKIAHIRCQAAGHGISVVETRGARLLLFRKDQPITTPNHNLPRLTSVDPDQKLQELSSLIDQLASYPN
jgi:transcription-repair coupling factor (superfamily II helicase)